ncbi:MAG: Hsp33 family molecular chaperone HslO [Gammaproteobacteria bacterium]|nr:Hsp33 family molecular chaperone HslO [Gammaproteobacteria bacterium]MBT3868951.1 Hsp33 family molecular chaperone HslO [Gammaproteobacteria bacterium]MBT4380033.1 Hsp33 family molecular chaperone HslO [Gammaproteobacteria bacterium]MBT4618834.1 Hsp33 family molecular chaperone HslO [Gammaproteobacteria bacterium]MBT5198780.1 Hsp33 family molecular chaperone HslO [Gammaproteobacteria bacterium]
MLDSSTRFVFVDADVRGNIVRLGDSFKQMTASHDYPSEVQELLGEFLAAALLLSDIIKFEGRLTLQANGQGNIRLLMAEATHEGAVRGIAQLEDAAPADAFRDKNLLQLLSGSKPSEGKLVGGTLTVTVEALGRERYQSIVPLLGETLAECLESYFQQSEQLNTFIRLSADSNQASGMLIQQLPVQMEQDLAQRADRWQTIRVLAGTITGAELIAKANSVLLQHLFVEENIQIFDATSVQFQCGCSEQRMAGALVSLGESELASLFEQHQTLALTCEFCGAHYDIDNKKLMRLVTEGVKPH